MEKPRLYLDTSVLGGYFDSEFAKATRMLFDDLTRARAIGVVSNLVLLELVKAPRQVKRLVEVESGIAWEFVEETPRSLDLADAYLSARVIGRKFRDDCRHVAIATVHTVDALVSWNLQHIVRFDRIRAFNAVNLAGGYAPLEIRTPLEVICRED